MHAPIEPVVRFDVFELDTRSGQLRKHGRRIRLPEQAFQVLSLLLAHPGEVVLRSELRQRLWPTATAGDFDSGLNNAVKKLRDALGDSAEAPRLIETVPRRGYRFLGEIAAPEPGPAPEPELAPAAEAAPVALVPPPASALSKPETRVDVLPENDSRGRFHLVTVLLLLLVGAAASYQSDTLAALVGGSAGPMRSIVVFPFDNLTGDASQDYFVDSVSAALTTHLSEIAGLEVTSRTTAQQFKRADKRIPEIGKALNVQGIVEGEVLRSGTDVRILVKLIRASSDRNVWSRPYDDSFANMISLQKTIAADVAAAAGLPRPQRAQHLPRTNNPQAFEAYLKGLQSKGLQRYEGFQRAVAYFEDAIKLQPDFAEAHAELAISQVQFLYGGPVSPGNAIPRAENAARIALELDPTLWQAHRALGLILNLYYWKWEEGGRSLRRAATLSGGRTLPADAGLDARESFEEALATAKRRREIDPQSVNAQVAVGSVYRRAGHYERAIEEYRRAVAMSPNQPRLHFNLGITFIAMSKLADATRAFETAKQLSPVHNTRFEAYLGYAYAAAGRTQEARAILAELETHRREGYVSSFGTALIHDALQEREPALAALQRAYEEHAVELALMNQYPPFQTIASDPRFQSIMKSVGLRR